MLVADFEVARREFSVRITLEVAPGERVALLGRSGAGKTTTVEAIAGLLRLTRGDVPPRERPLSSARHPNVDLPPRAARVGLLRQNPGLFPHLTVLQNIGTRGASMRAMLGSRPERLGLGALLNARPRGLSGGEAQRVSLARALLSKVDLFSAWTSPSTPWTSPRPRSLLDLLRRETGRFRHLRHPGHPPAGGGIRPSPTAWPFSIAARSSRWAIPASWCCNRPAARWLSWSATEAGSAPAPRPWPCTRPDPSGSGPRPAGRSRRE